MTTDTAPPIELGARERQCLDGIARGLTNAEIGAELCLSVDTVKTYVRRLYRRLGARNRTDATMIALRAGLLDERVVSGG